ncbi:15243_t:CDS:2 [Dentiscutata erythropus]|uniref:15243_t:CDS:1 n=1 Tax=Dentiscutata erythropus TaxID=1348616 RepID=A0A9N9IWJ4_9GLOM|nr:15243_t:CDS:2 [Dentiscutata erythropus]
MYISGSECSEAGVSYVLHMSDEEETVVTAGEVLEKHPELLELYECLNNSLINFPSSPLQSKTMPNGQQKLMIYFIDNAALDLLESCQSQHYHPPEQHIQRLMDTIVSDQVDDDIASRSYKVLQHVLQTSGNAAFQNIWTFEQLDAEQGTLWENYVNFWKFIENLFTSLTKVDKSDRIMMLLDHIVSVIEIDIKVKKEELNSTLLLKLIPKSYGRVRTNIKDLVNALLSPFHEEVSIETARLSQRILKQIIILSHAGHICSSSLITEIYQQMNKFKRSQLKLFLQTMLSSTFKCMLLDLALRNTDFSRIPRQNRAMVTSPLSFVKFVNIYFDSKPYNKNDPTSLWRHIFILCSAFQSYVDSKTMRVGHKVFCGLNDEERKLIIDKVINERVAELKKRIDGEKMDSELKKNTKFLLEIMNIDIERIYRCLENSE